jgi:hypothetical protein
MKSLTSIGLIFRRHPEVYVKVNMPPITRTQTKSLPNQSEPPIKYAPTLTSPASAASRRRPHRTKGAKQQFQAEKKTANLPNDSPEVHPQSPPHFTINLSLPPSERYAEVCHALRDEMCGLQSLFDEVVGGFLPYWLHLPSIVLNWVAWALLWRVCDAEEDDELDVSCILSKPIFLQIDPRTVLYDANLLRCTDWVWVY